MQIAEVDSTNPLLKKIPPLTRAARELATRVSSAAGNPRA